MTDGVQPGPSPERAGRRATIRDVAQVAGVSRSTASRALTGTGYVGRGVRERVQLAAEGLGYVPDAMARHLKQQVSRSIGLLVPDLRSAFCADVVAGVTREARRRGYATILTGDLTDGDDGVQAAERFVALRVAGVVVVPVSGDVTAYLSRRRTPVVEVDRHFGHGPTDAVVVDDVVLSRDLTRHLLELGHRRLALVVDRLDWTTGRDRREGFLAACRDAGLDDGDAVVVAVLEHDDADHLTTQLLRGPGAPTAVVAASEPIAAATWRAAGRLGLRIPQDLSLVSVDDAAWLGMVTPPVTAGERDGVALGAVAVARLLEPGRPDGRTDLVTQAGPGAPSGLLPGRTVVASRVVLRGSTAVPERRTGAPAGSRPERSDAIQS